jgi:hypothetical protein
MNTPMPGYCRIIAVFLLLAWPKASTRCQEAEIKSEAATLRIDGVRQDSDRLTARLSSRIVVTIRIECGKALDVEPAKLLADSPDWEVTATPAAAEPELWQESFILRPVKPGPLNIPLQTLRYRENSASRWQVVKWPVVVINVTTEVLNPNPNDLHDHLEPEYPPSASFSWERLVLPILAAALAFSLACTWFMLRKRNQTATPPDALAELEKIAGLPLENPKEIEYFHSRLSEVFRGFLQRSLGLPVTKRTTEELLAQIGAEHPCKEQIAEILKTCDLVKFARTIPVVSSCRMVLDAARGVITELSLDVPQKRTGEQQNGSIG